MGGIRKQGADWGRLVCTLHFDCTRTHVGRGERFAGVMNLRSWKRDEGKAIRVHHPQLQRGCVILCSSATEGESTLIRWSLLYDDTCKRAVQELSPAE